MTTNQHTRAVAGERLAGGEREPSPRASPYHFRPMAELLEEGREVEMALRGTGEVVTGWLFRGHPRVARTFWGRSPRGESIRLDPIGWRDPPTPEAIAAWKEASAA